MALCWITLSALAVALRFASGINVSFNETRRCQSAVYYYGVLSTEMVCSSDAAEEGSTKCKKSVISKFCGDSDAHYKCDTMVDVFRAADYFNTSIQKETWHHNDGEYYPVQWLMEGNADPAYYFRLRESYLEQYLYKVDDSNVEPEHCATLVVNIGDRDKITSMEHIWNTFRYEPDHTLAYYATTKIPLPSSLHCTRTGRYFTYSQLYSAWKDSRVKIRVNYLIYFKRLKIEGERAVRESSPTPAIGLQVIKEDFGVEPSKLQIVGSQELVCYRKQNREDCYAGIILQKVSCPSHTHSKFEGPGGCWVDLPS